MESACSNPLGEGAGMTVHRHINTEQMTCNSCRVAWPEQPCRAYTRALAQFKHSTQSLLKKHANLESHTHTT